ncbi:MAG: TnpV protein, partial [Clostridia bacterium]|nr:TnpV protein [Clostridia bacterium]
ARLNYLKTNKKAEYMIMFTKGTLNNHLKKYKKQHKKD